ncbi:T9SS type A sorting domain-containing protein [Chryseobacterium sp. YIM B08800]|uniref:T9SS type A sorting domain-containing protein n=1 Tax=Chryseobacterium sp. YIM B08800 TaxID=2984136 RepID=UPI00223F67CF|nr:T9SS type A sorting domain-containing protein [Chryseobacterium sp. YIM B08800]
MKKLYFLTIMAFLCSGFMKAQFGSCANARPITNGFTEANITTAGTGTAPESWVTSFSSQCLTTSGGQYYGSVFTSTGGDYLFSYTSGSVAGESISITIQTHTPYQGVAMFTSCNGTSIDGCVAWKYNAQAGTATLTTSNLGANQTVYIAVGIWASPNNLNFSVTNFTVTPSSLSVDENELKTSSNVYPNPVKDVLNISNLKEKTNVAIIDMNGKVVIRETVSGEGKINVSHLIPGVYIVNVGTKEEGNSYKIIKK